MKVLITSGCSFSNTGDYTNGTSTQPDTWVEHLHKYCRFDRHIPMGVSSNGQELISRRLIQAVDKALEEKVSPKDICVAVMWSTVDRAQFYVNNRNSHTRRMLEPSISPRSPLQWPKQDQTGKWAMINVGFNNKFSQRYYKDIYNETHALVNTYEHVLRTQWYLERLGIDYFMTTINEYTFDKTHAEPLQYDYLERMVDWSKFLPVEGELNWVKQNFPVREEWFHPNFIQHGEFTKKVIIPFMKNNKNLSRFVN